MSEVRFENIKLAIVGTGEYQNILKQKCHDLSLNSKVDFIGYCTREKLPQLYGQSDAFILTSRSEAFGNVFAEGMSCRLPVIGANVGGIPDLISNKTGILVEPGDIAGIKDAILKLSRSKSLRMKMGQAGRELILKKHQWPRIADRYLQLYIS